MSDRMYRCALSTLLPNDVAAADLWDWAEASPLTPEERSMAKHMTPKRRREFTAGRDCGRRALTHLGLSNVTLGRSDAGLPCWPVGTTGSITHTDNYAAAAVAHRDNYLGIGIDAETVGRMTPNLWSFAFTERERAWLLARDQAAQDTYATVIFSAKEAFYKSQFIPFGMRLDFQDIEIEVRTADFRIHMTHAHASMPQPRTAYRVMHGRVLTMALFPMEQR